MQLNKAQQAELTFLRRQVDAAQEAALRRDGHPDVQQDLWRARNELTRFVDRLREDGFDI